jgi:mannose-6-phosphate isomerase-like protein (cupin superfamily)
MIAKPRESYRAYRIAPGDTNRMVLLFDPLTDAANFVAIIEIFDEGGRTPPNMHKIGQEMFYVLKGEGRAHGTGDPIDFRTGDSLLAPPGTWHEVENTGPGRLYCLTVMVPNDGFAELILAGEPVPIDDDDWAVIAGTAA